MTALETKKYIGKVMIIIKSNHCLQCWLCKYIFFQIYFLKNNEK